MRAGPARRPGGTAGTAGPSTSRAATGSPRSRPSEQITTMPPRPTPRRAPPAHERVERRADPRAALPVHDRERGLAQRLVRGAGPQRGRDAGEPGAEAEHLHPPRRPPCGEGELQQRARVVRHRPGHVQHQHQRSRPHPAPPPVQLHQLAVRAHRPAHRPPQVRRAAGRPPRRVRRVRRRGGVEPDARHDPAQRRQLLVGAVGERPVPHDVHCGRGEAQRRLLGRPSVPGSVAGTTNTDSAIRPASPAAPARSPTGAAAPRKYRRNTSS